jgi:hypothetical protein
MQSAGGSLCASGVAAVYLVHGTFLGDDALGILGELARVLPTAGKAVRRIVKHAVDALTGDAGNYTGAFARLMEESLNPPGCDALPVRRFHWSSENHHIGRADGAVRLIAELASLGLGPGGRVLLWGHSHGGNVLAIVTNLLGGDRRRRERFFQAAEIYYRWPLLGCVDIPIWQRVRELLLDGQQPLGGAALDIVTFGTPIRYGWDPEGYSRLLHFIHHRPAEGLPAYRAPFPPRLENIFRAADGDYVQQFGIAGTNVAPSILSPRARIADRRLGRILQPELSAGDALDRFRAGAIVPDEGVTLLVDYGRPDGGFREHLAGHAVYTRRKWMLFHLEETARRFYHGALRRAS